MVKLMFKDLVLKNRSCRSFDPNVKISRDQLLDFVDCARLCPSAMNKQPLRYRLILSADECAKVLSLTGWAGALKDIKIPPEGHEPCAYILICADTDEFPDAARSRDIGISAQTIMLAAAEAGFGGCIIGNFSADKIKAALNLKASISPLLLLALGKPDEHPVITECRGESTSYYRENGIHYVPKRALADIIID